MLVFFDECYDLEREFLLLGALFNPRPKRLHQAMLKAKQELNYVDSSGQPKEIKYTLSNKRDEYDVARKCVDCFVGSPSWFRTIVICTKPEEFDLRYFGSANERNAIKMARAYKKFAEMLISANSATIENGVLLTDRLTRARGDLFLELMRENFCQPGVGFSVGKARPTFRAIEDIDTALPPYQVGQICDILTGVVLNALKPTKNRYKTRLRNHVMASLRLPSLEPDYWRKLERWQAQEMHPKFGIWYWTPR